jgi:predicted  nucleic acid-binding Zn-ribbon protein
MSKNKQKPTNDLMMELKNLEVEFNNLKQKIVDDYNRLEVIEKEYNDIYKEIIKRLSGKK